MEPEEIKDETILKEQIKQRLEECPSLEICAKITNPDEKLWCTSYVYKWVNEHGFTISEAIGALDEYLNELHN